MSDLRRIGSAIAWSSLAKAATVIAQVLVFAILTRILNPADFGMIAFVAMFLFLFNALGQFGIPNALVQAPSLDQGDIHAAGCIISVCGLIGAVSMMILSPAIEQFCNMPGLSSVMRVASLGIPLGMVAGFHQALLRRAMRFRELASIDMLASLIAAGSAILIALLEGGVWALVGLHLVDTLIKLLGRSWTSQQSLALPRSSTALYHMLRSGLSMFANQAIGMVNQRLDVLLIGPLMGAVFLGHFSVGIKALRIVIEFTTTITASATLAGLSRMQDRLAEQVTVMARLNRHLALLSLPLYLLLAEHAHDLIRVAFGPGWETSADVLAVMAMLGIPTCLNYLSSTALVANGHVGVLSLLHLGFTLLAVLSFGSLLFWHWPYALSLFVGLISLYSWIRIRVCCAVLGIATADYYRPFCKPLVLTLTLLAIDRILLQPILAPMPSLPNLMVSIICYGMVLLGYVLLFDRPTRMLWLSVWQRAWAALTAGGPGGPLRGTTRGTTHRDNNRDNNTHRENTHRDNTHRDNTHRDRRMNTHRDRRMNILLVGVTGLRNRGVEALVLSIQAELGRIWPDHHMTIASSEADYDARRGWPDITWIDDCRSLLKSGMRSRARRICQAIRPGHAWQTLLNHIDAADLVLCTGGDILSSEYGHDFLASNLSLLDIAHNRGVPTALLAQSIGPFHNDRDRTRFLRTASNCTQISCRERMSFDYIKGIMPQDVDLRHVADPAFLLPVLDTEPGRALRRACLPHGANYLAVGASQGVCRFLGMDDEAHSTAWATLLDSLVTSTLCDVVLVPHVQDARPHNDDRIKAAAIWRRMQQRDRAHILPSELSAIDYKTVIAGANLVIAERMHVAIAGLSTGVCTAALRYSVKALGITQDILGTSECNPGVVIDGTGILDPTDMHHQLISLWERRTVIAATISAQLPAYRLRAQQAFSALLDIPLPQRVP